MAIDGLQKVPAPHAELAKYIARHPEKPIAEVMEPYRKYEAQLRTLYAQDRQNPALEDPYLNVLPLFTDDTRQITTRARNLAAESHDEKSRYIMALPDDKRRPNGSPATVTNLSEFRKLFNIFSESSLVELDWRNVVAAGSSVVNCLLPVPKEFNTTKRKLREYYHEKFCPASDVDLFLYGLTHEEAIEKIKNIEQSIRDALLNEVTVVRTKFAITIASQYPVRHVQIVLRVYKSISEILTGFDIDAAGGAYDGSQVYTTPRALGSFITQINHIDLSRRSPSYENRLSKYSHRNFEVYWPELDRSRIDPTIYERSFKRTLGLARLLVLERLPTTSARDTYLNERRRERGRPTVFRGRFRLGGNLKDDHEDELADWLPEEDTSNYHTFTVPYGGKFNAKRIEKLCYTRDLLLNAEWNQPKDRPVYLHRHPAFFGRVEHVIEDCCGACPKPVTPEEIEVAEKEAEVYISGKLFFLIDDPGRQQIGSFNPLTEQDWTDMAYVGNTTRLCQSIVDGDVEGVLGWLSQEGNDPNKRDYTGRTPLHLAVSDSTPDVVRSLLDHGARLTARLADGKTALHLAASRGSSEITRILMEKSVQNEEAEGEKQDRHRKAITAGQVNKLGDSGETVERRTTDSDSSGNSSDGELVGGEETDSDIHSIATGSFIQVNKNDEEGANDPADSDNDPDYYQIDVVAWDVPCSPLHLAIVEGHEEVVKCLCDFGADSILPVKFFDLYSNDDTEAILTLTLALSLPAKKAKSMAKLLLKLGATCSQADVRGCTAFHRYVSNGSMELLDMLLEADKTGVKSAINHVLFTGYSWSPVPVTPLHTAIERRSTKLVLSLLDSGALSHIDFETWLKSAKVSPLPNLGSFENNKQRYKDNLEQPLVVAVLSGNVDIALSLLEKGANPSTLTLDTHLSVLDEYRRQWSDGDTVLDLVRKLTATIGKYQGETLDLEEPQWYTKLDTYHQGFNSGTYAHWVVTNEMRKTREASESEIMRYKEDFHLATTLKGKDEKRGAIEELARNLKKLEADLQSRGAKTFDELHPEIKTDRVRDSQVSEDDNLDRSPKSYSYSFSFDGEEAMTDQRRDAYVELLVKFNPTVLPFTLIQGSMEAAWDGDIDRLKSLTLQAWGSQREERPLRMAATTARRGDSPFSLAFLRGQYSAARAILDIIKAQWSPCNTRDVRYQMEARDEDDEHNDEGFSDSGSSEPRIVAQKVDKEFTIENVGRVSMQVTSHTKPIDDVFMNHPTLKMSGDGNVVDCGTRSLFVHAMETDDAAGLKFLLDVTEYHLGQQYGDGDEAEDCGPGSLFPVGAFMWAIDNGKVDYIGTIIKRTGAGIPFGLLVKKSGVEMKEKPRFYQGLTVYGKKRKDWATAGRRVWDTETGLETPPILRAALQGSIESVEFFLSDDPHSLYSEFSKSKVASGNKWLKHLEERPGGFDRAITKWLGLNNDLVIHCAVMATPSKKTGQLLQHLTDTCPGSIDKKSDEGDTPLMTACRLGRPQFVKILVAANADQSTRNTKGENILHAALAGNPKAGNLRVLLDLLDGGLRRHLFLQRKNLRENGTTPMHAWIAQLPNPPYVHRSYSSYQHGQTYYPRSNQNIRKELDMLRLLLEYSKGAELEMFNGAGDTPLHTLIKDLGLPSLTKVLVDFRPELLYRENAVGRTPAEIAHDIVVGETFAKPTPISLDKSNYTEELWRFTAPDQFLPPDSVKDMSPEQVAATVAELGLSDNYDGRQLARVLGSLGLAQDTPSMELSDESCKRVTWDLCRTAMRRHPGRRRLVSLNEANDVARRLGEQYTGSRYFGVQRRGEEDWHGPRDSRAEKDDFVARELSLRLDTAWKYPDDT